MKIGYARISTQAQIAALEKEQCGLVFQVNPSTITRLLAKDRTLILE